MDRALGACAAAVSALGLAVACGPGEDAPQVGAVAPAPEAPSGAGEESARPTESAPARAAKQGPARAAPPDPAAVSEGDLLAPEPVPLEVLLRVPVTTSGAEVKRSSALDAVEPPSVAPKLPTGVPSWRERIRVERRSEAIGPVGPRQGTYSETDAGLRVPVDERVSLEGGVRVDQRDEPGEESPERKSSPRVGVEFRF